MQTIVFNLILLIILTEALVEISKSYITTPVWNILLKMSTFNSSLQNYMEYFLSCGYCKSFWASLITCSLCYKFEYFPILIHNSIFNFILITLLVQRFSNIWHFIIDRVDIRKDIRYNREDL